MIINTKAIILLYLSIIYLLFGLLICIYLLIDEISSFPEDGMLPLIKSRPKSYYYYKIYIFLVIFNCISGILKFFGGICCLIYRSIIMDIKDTCIKYLYLSI